ncbi:hypothetical protein VNO78_13857 [Psophocarpus tetragonolobus]|uniref:Uncharacterized protein n=1 Tax=Psophocarpus tetragonolobus TaxID=3891 RepID=A0AAN9SQT8_PSOTE
MVVSLGPGKFYGTSLPRPRIYTDVKFNDHRVDPPTPVSDPLMSWAQEAHWSMGGLSFKRLRLQGKIEGNVQRLRSQREAHSPTPTRASPIDSSPSPPPPPLFPKRRRYMDLIQEEEEDEDEDEHEHEDEHEGAEVQLPSTVNRRRRLVKKLGDDFDRVALRNDQSHTVLFKTPTKRFVKAAQSAIGNKTTTQSQKTTRVRTSPRLAKRLSI